MKFLFFFCFFTLYFDNSFSQYRDSIFRDLSNYDNLIISTANVVGDSFSNYEGNPIHKSESMYINSLFEISLVNHFEAKTFEYPFTTETILQLLHKNFVDGYEDSPDMRRMAMRKSQCFATLALICDDYLCSSTYIRFAKFSISQICMNNPLLHLENQFTALLFLEIMINFEEYNTHKANIEFLFKYLKENKNKLSPDKYDLFIKLYYEWKKVLD